MSIIKIAVLPGDGIGREVMECAIPVFSALNIPVELKFGEIGWECWKRDGNPVPNATWELINESDATLLGAITSMPEREAIKALPPHLQKDPPQYVSPVIQLRQELDLYANLRPCESIDGSSEIFDFCIIRENTEGLYSGFDYHPIPKNIKELLDSNAKWQEHDPDNLSCSLRIQSEEGLSRLFEYSFKHADNKKYSRVTLADKANVLRKSSDFTRKIFESVAKKYPHIKADILNVDAIALWMVRRPHQFGVIVAENMFGDILSDLGAGIMGGLGFAPSANIGNRGAYFEPVHGSAPNIQKGKANPSAMFLTIGLLLEYFGYNEESSIIKNAVKSVIRSGKMLTYDLGGSSSTNEMAESIINTCLSPQKSMKLSFLATGNEIVEGEILDTNSNYFSKSLTAAGVNIYQHIQVSDRKSDISQAIKHLLSYSNSILITGGLGPTSDDNTRFAVSEIVGKQLVFDEDSWLEIEKRFIKYQLKLTDSNRKQAIFPEGSVIYPNPNGTARGCYLNWHDKHIFMLPGPPKECIPIFEEYVLPTLESLGFFSKTAQYRWLTLGLVEGDIAEKVDTIAKKYGLETGYRWSYPYLEIKLKYSGSPINLDSISEVGELLSDSIVSEDGDNALESLKDALKTFTGVVYIQDQNSPGINEELIGDSKFVFLDRGSCKIGEYAHLCIFESSIPIMEKPVKEGVITFSCQGFSNKVKIYENQLTVPCRDSRITEFAKAYLAWQLKKYIQTIEGLKNVAI